MEDKETKRIGLLDNAYKYKDKTRFFSLRRGLNLIIFRIILAFILLVAGYYHASYVSLAEELTDRNILLASSFSKNLVVENTNIQITRYIDGNRNDWFIDFYKLDGKQAFCVDPAVSATTGMKYQSTNSDTYINRYVNRGDLPKRLALAVYFGYNHNNFSKNYRMNKAFTQMLIWKMIIQDNKEFRNSEGERISYVGFTDQDLKKSFEKFQVKVDGEINKALNSKTSFDEKTYSLEQGKSIELKDNKGALQNLKFKLNNSKELKLNGISLNIVGNTLKIQADIKADLTKISKIEMIYKEINSKSMEGINLFFADSESKGQKMGILDKIVPNISTLKIKAVKRPVKNGRIKISKLIEKNKGLCAELKDIYKLDGARFSIRDSQGKLIQTLEYKDGKIPLSKELKPGKYKVEETRMPSSNAFINTVGKLKAKTIIVEEGKTSYLQFKNTPKFDPILVLLRKYDENDHLLANAKFKISYFKNKSIDSPGKAKKAKADRVWIWRTNRYGSINMSFDKPLGGSSSLYKDDNNTPVFLPGSYLFEEIEPPEGYLASDPVIYHMDVEKFNGKYQSWNVKKFVNKKIKGKIKLIKTDDSEGKRPVEDAVFGIYKYEDNRLVDKIKTNSLGIAFSKDLEYGKYYLKELAVDKRYEIDDKEQVFEIKTNKEIVELKSINKLYGVKLKIKKLDKNSNKGLAGAVFEVFDDKGESICTLKTDDRGIAISKNKLLLGKYKLVEKVVPKGYVRGKDIDFKVDRDRKTIELGEKTGKAVEIIIKNEPTYHKIIKKSLNNMKPLEGAQLVLRNKKSKRIIRKWISKKEAEVFMGLEVGETYEILEEKAPLEYMRNNLIEEFTVEDSDEKFEHEIFNEKNPEISTRASFKNAGKIKLRNKTVQIVDRVFYKNLIVGKTYRLEGRLMDKSSKKPLEIRGEYLTSDLTFKATKSSGEITMTYLVPRDIILDKTLVVFEDLYSEDRLLTSHRDIEDLSQTLKFEKNLETTKYKIKKKRTENPKTDDSDVRSVGYLFAFCLLGYAEIESIKRKIRKKSK